MTAVNDLDEVATFGLPSAICLQLKTQTSLTRRSMASHRFACCKILRDEAQTQSASFHHNSASATLTFNIPQHPDVISRHKINGNSLSSESATAANTVNVVLPVCGQVVVDNQRHLLHVDTASKQIGSDQNTRRARAKLLHQNLPLLLIHVSVLS